MEKGDVGDEINDRRRRSKESDSKKAKNKSRGGKDGEAARDDDQKMQSVSAERSLGKKHMKSTRRVI